MINVIDMIYEQMRINNPPRERKMRHYPSSLPHYIDDEPHGKCKRQLVFQMMGVEESHPIDPVALFKMDMGNMIHDKVDEILTQALKRKYGDNFNIDDQFLQEYIDKYVKENPEAEIDRDGAEIPIVWNINNLEFPMSGRIDKIINIQGRRGICEWKSTYGYGVNDIKKNGPKLEALLQARAYLENNVIPLDFIILVYIARDSGYMYGWFIEFGDDRDKLMLYHMNSGMTTTYVIKFDDTIKALNDVENAVRNDRLPDRDYHAMVNTKTNTLTKSSAWQCRYCSHRGICYGVND